MEIETSEAEFWMTNLPQKLRSRSIIYLAIPGSHDSATYAIKWSSGLAPDAERPIRRLRFLGPILKYIMSKWSKTQGFSVTEQLHHGIRYFDLRVAPRKRTDKFYFVHGQYAAEVDDFLGEVQAFLDTHDKEVVILDFNHFYAFDTDSHQGLTDLLVSTFGPKLLPYDNMQKITLDYMTAQNQYQVIVVYRMDGFVSKKPFLWPSKCFPTPWANTMSIESLMQFLVEGVRKRDNSIGFISQCVLTPSSGFVVRHLFSSLKTQCTAPLEIEKYKWLREQKPGHGGVNIIISDFVDYDKTATFAKEVIALNLK